MNLLTSSRTAPAKELIFEETGSQGYTTERVPVYRRIAKRSGKNYFQPKPRQAPATRDTADLETLWLQQLETSAESVSVSLEEMVNDPSFFSFDSFKPAGLV